MCVRAGLALVVSQLPGEVWVTLMLGMGQLSLDAGCAHDAGHGRGFGPLLHECAAALADVDAGTGAVGIN